MTKTILVTLIPPILFGIVLALIVDYVTNRSGK
jgi:hypothetical protein